MARLGVAGAIVGGRYVPGDVSIQDGVIDEVGVAPGGTGLAVPGFVDLQVNGFGGIDFFHADEDQWRQANRLLHTTGVTSYVANLISNDAPSTEAALAMAAAVHRGDAGDGARLLGVHLEGPFLASAKAGIHPHSHLVAPDPALVKRLTGAGPLVLATIAPELPGAIELIRSLHDQGVAVSLGHSDCTAEEAIAGFDAGANTVTHLFNAMSGITARAPGLAGAALAREAVWLQLILDFLHVDRVLVEFVLGSLGSRVVLVTDCLPVTGTDLTRSSLADIEIDVVEGRAVNAQGVLAGSTLTMDQALRNAIACGMAEVDAVNTTSWNPVRVIRPEAAELLSPGAVADVVVLSDAFEIQQVFSRGVECAIEGVR